MRMFRISHWLKTRLWFLPLMMVLAAMILASIAIAVDADGSLVPQSVTGDPTAALQILYLISFAMLTLTGLVLSLLVLAVQLAMGTFSPRIVRQILQDRPSQAAIGLFAGTFAFSLLVMRRVTTTQDGGTVPGLAVLVAIVLVLACVMTLIWYLNHITQSLRVAALTGWVARDTLTALDRVYPPDDADPAPAPDLLTSRASGVMFDVDHDRLVALAERADCRLELLWAVGDFVPAHAPLVRVVGDPGRTGVAPGHPCHRPGTRANLEPGRGLRHPDAGRHRRAVPLVRPLRGSDDGGAGRRSNARRLRQIARRPLHSGTYRDGSGTPRLVVPTLQWEGFVRLTFDEIRQTGAGSPQVVRRLRAALEDLLQVAPPSRRPPLEHQLDLLDEQAGTARQTDSDRRNARVADRSGLGSSTDLTTPPDPADQVPQSR